MTNPIQASIIIPTYNRAGYLTICLEAIASLNTSPSNFEIIVVDNNSSDNTSGIVSDYTDAHLELNVHYVNEKQKGLSYGRNRGVSESIGEILCFIDDDAYPTPEWLNAFINGFNDPAVGCAGGPAILDYQGQERPSWLKGDLQGLLSGYQLSYHEPTPITKYAEFPFGCNMAFRKKVLVELGSFRTDLDRSGDEVLAAGDTEMCNRVYKDGWKVMYLPEAQVRHIVAPERLKKSYIYRIGRGLAASHVILTSDPRHYMILRWFASDLWYTIRTFSKLIGTVIRGNPLWYDDYIRFWIVAQRLPIRFLKIINNNG
jgi:glycosyltransferase involved in cell wall biosynthesis